MELAAYLETSKALRVRLLARRLQQYSAALKAAPVSNTGDYVVNIESTIMHILVNDVFVSVPQSQICLDESLRDILGLDSLGFMELRTQCEYAFGVTISDDDFAPGNFASVRTLAQLVARLRESLPDEAISQ